MNESISLENTVIDFHIYHDVAKNESLLQSLIQQWIGIYNKNHKTSFVYLTHAIEDVRIKEHKKVNITVAKLHQ